MNAQLPVYCSWKPDPGALAIDALSILWTNNKTYLFPPFVLIPCCLNKARKEGVAALLIAPVWPNQIWFPQLLSLLVDRPYLLPPTQSIVSDPRGQPHPLVVEGHLPLATWYVSGDPAMPKAYLTESQRSYAKSWRGATESAYSSACMAIVVSVVFGTGLRSTFSSFE